MHKGSLITFSDRFYKSKPAENEFIHYALVLFTLEVKQMLHIRDFSDVSDEDTADGAGLIVTICIKNKKQSLFRLCFQ